MRGEHRSPSRPRPGGLGRRAGLARTATALLLAVAVPPGPSAALAQSSNTLTLHRSEASIRLVNTGRADQGARTLLNLPDCVADEELRSSVFYAPGGGVTANIAQDEGGEETVVHAPLMVVLEPGDAPADGASGGAAASADPEASAGDTPAGNEATLEALDATASFPGRPPCPEEIEEAAEPGVRLEQGRTTVVGGRFFLDRETDVATMDGPVALTRTPDGDAATVEARADALRFDLEADRSTLTGGVTVQAGERVSEADELELDEAAGLAVLRGSPAVSRQGSDEIRGERLLYDLETNDVTVEGNVSATFERE